MTNSYNYRNAKPITPTGIVVHSTGVNNKNIKRYVNPLETDDNYQSVIDVIGKNGSNDYNHKSVSKGVHAYIGVGANGIDIYTCHCLPYDKSAFGVGNGTKIIGTKEDGSPLYGSYNYDPNARIQFEICEDDLTDENYFNAVMKESQEYCAYLCKKFNLTVDNICSHQEGHTLGYASNHADIRHWLIKFNKDMDWYRQCVQEEIDKLTAEEFRLLDIVKIKDECDTYANGKALATWVKRKELFVRAIEDDKITISTVREGAITGTVFAKDLILIKRNVEDSPVEETIIENVDNHESEVVQKAEGPAFEEYETIEIPSVIVNADDLLKDEQEEIPVIDLPIIDEDSDGIFVDIASMLLENKISKNMTNSHSRANKQFFAELIELQKESGIPATGIVDDLTWAILFNLNQQEIR